MVCLLCGLVIRWEPVQSMEVLVLEPGSCESKLNTLAGVCQSLTVVIYCHCHRRLILRTDGGYARVCELGSIDLFVVTSWKWTNCHTNFEHKFPIMYGVLTANLFALWSAFSVLLWPPVIQLADSHCEMLLVFRPFSCRLISEVSWPIITKLCYVFEGDCSL